MSETLASRALNTLHEWVQSESLRKHCYAVADSMKHFAKLRGGDVDLWEAVGLLHDMDYERHRTMSKTRPMATQASELHGSATMAGARRSVTRFCRTRITRTSHARRRSSKPSTLWMN